FNSERGVNGGEVGGLGGQLGLLSGELGRFGGKLGLLSGELGRFGGELGLLSGELGRFGGKPARFHVWPRLLRGGLFRLLGRELQLGGGGDGPARVGRRWRGGRVAAGCCDGGEPLGERCRCLGGVRDKGVVGGLGEVIDLPLLRALAEGDPRARVPQQLGQPL